MADEVVVESAPDPKRVKAEQIYTAWRNRHLNNVAPTEFARLEAASPFLIDEIAAAL